MTDEGRSFLPPSAAAASAEDRLENFSEEIYNYLKEEIKAVANGEKTSTSFQISDPNGILKWTKADLGVSSIASGGSFTQEALDAAGGREAFLDIPPIRQLMVCPTAEKFLCVFTGTYFDQQQKEAILDAIALAMTEIDIL